MGSKIERAFRREGLLTVAKLMPIGGLLLIINVVIIALAFMNSDHAKIIYLWAAVTVTGNAVVAGIIISFSKRKKTKKKYTINHSRNKRISAILQTFLFASPWSFICFYIFIFTDDTFRYLGFCMTFGLAAAGASILLPIRENAYTWLFTLVAPLMTAFLFFENSDFAFYGSLFTAIFTIFTYFQIGFMHMSFANRMKVQLDLEKIRTRMADTENELKRMTDYDADTGFRNRHSFISELKAWCKHGAKQTTSPFAFFVISLDVYHSYDRLNGPDTSDAILQAVSLRVGKIFDPEDLVGRLNDHQIAVLVNEVADFDAVERFTQDIARDLSKPYLVRKKEHPVQCSVSVIYGSRRLQDATSMIRCAAKAATAARRSQYQQYYALNLDSFFEKSAERQVA